MTPGTVRSRALGAAVGGAGAAGLYLFWYLGPGLFLPPAVGLFVHAAGGAVGGAAGFRLGGPVVAAAVTVGLLLARSGGNGAAEMWPYGLFAAFAAAWANLAEWEVRRSRPHGDAPPPPANLAGPAGSPDRS